MKDEHVINAIIIIISLIQLTCSQQKQMPNCLFVYSVFVLEEKIPRVALNHINPTFQHLRVNLQQEAFATDHSPQQLQDLKQDKQSQGCESCVQFFFWFKR